MTVPLNGLNKIDPIILNNVQKQTVENVVHSSKGIVINKDAGEKKKDPYSYKSKKQKLAKLNSMLKSMGKDIFFRMDEEGVAAMDGNGNVIRVYSIEEIDELIEKIEDMAGTLLDTRK